MIEEASWCVDRRKSDPGEAKVLPQCIISKPESARTSPHEFYVDST